MCELGELVRLERVNENEKRDFPRHLFAHVFSGYCWDVVPMFEL